jgi:hypothetical protein
MKWRIGLTKTSKFNASAIYFTNNDATNFADYVTQPDAARAD